MSEGELLKCKGNGLCYKINKLCEHGCKLIPCNYCGIEIPEGEIEFGRGYCLQCFTNSSKIRIEIENYKNELKNKKEIKCSGNIRLIYNISHALNER